MSAGSVADTFRAATWNVYHGTPLAELEPILHKLQAQDVSLFLLQEASRDGLQRMIRSAGLRCYYVAPQYVIAWAPALWDAVDRDAVVLSGTDFVRVGGQVVTRTPAALVELRHVSGRHLTALTYHTPSGVQRGGEPNTAVSNRLQVLRESATTMRELADERDTDAVLFGGDDNVDERKGTGWGFLRRRSTGLRQVQAPAATIGRREPGDRRIDDFRVRGLQPLDGYVRPGGGDHRVHVRRFAWKGVQL